MAIITYSVGTAGRTYSTLAIAIAAIPANVVASGNSYVLELWADSEFVGGAPLANIAGFTTDATHTITVKCAAGQSFYDNATKTTNALRYNAANGVAIRATSGYLNSTFSVSSDYVTLDGLQIAMDFGSSTGCLNTGAANGVVKNCLGWVTPVDGNRSTVIADHNGSTAFVNCVAIQESTFTNAACFQLSVGAYNCTAICTTTGSTSQAYANGYAAPIIKNCVSIGCGYFCRGSSYPIAAGSDYNATDLAIGTYLGAGTHNVFSLVAANTFQSVTASAVDVRVKAGSILIGAGLRDAAYTADLDIIKQLRSTTTPTIGAFEYVVVVAGYPPRAIYTLARTFKTFQPQYAGGINWANPFARGLAMAINPGTGWYDSVNGRIGVPNGTLLRASVRGSVFSTAGSSSIGASFGPTAIVTSDGVRTGDFTILTICNATGPAATEFPYGCFGSNEFYMGSNLGVGFSAGGAAFSAFTNAGGASGVQANGAVDGDDHIFAYTRAGTVGTLYRDGKNLASNTVTAAAFSSATSYDYIGGYNASGYGVIKTLGLVVAWNRALTSAEIIRYSANPWQIFK